jgi:hypothetical protein
LVAEFDDGLICLQHFTGTLDNWKPSLAKHLGDPTLKGYAVLQKIFFAPTSSSQSAGGAFIGRLAQRKENLDAVLRRLDMQGRG